MHEELKVDEYQATQAYWDRMKGLRNQMENILEQLKTINSENISRGHNQKVWEKTIESVETTTRFLSVIANPISKNLL